MKRLLSLLALNALLCPAYAMDTAAYLTKLENTVEQYVNTEAVAGEILRYYLLGKINIKEFKDILKKKAVFSDLAKLLRIDEATLNKHFDTIAPHLVEVINQKALENVIKMLIEGKKVDAKTALTIVNKDKAITLLSNKIGADSNELKALVERITDDQLPKHKAALQNDLIETNTVIRAIQKAIEEKTIALNNCKSTLDAKRVAHNASLSQNSGSSLSTLAGVAATGMLLSQSVCTSCDSYINSGWLALTGISAAVTAIMHNNAKQNKSAVALEESKEIQAQITIQAALENDILRLSSELNAANEHRTDVSQMISDLEEVETKRGSVTDQSWQLAENTLKMQAINYLAKKAGVDMSQMQADAASNEAKAFIASIKPEQRKKLSSDESLTLFAMMPEMITQELQFLASLDNEQCTALAKILEENNAEKVEEFNAFGASVSEHIGLLDVPARFLLAEYTPILLMMTDEDRFTEALTEDQAALLVAMLPEAIQKELNKK